MKINGLSALLISITMSSFAHGSTELQHANDNSEVLLSAGTGAFLGTAIAGPIGFAVGGVMGILLGNSDSNHQALQYSNQQLGKEKAARLTAQNTVKRYQHSLEEANRALNESKLSELLTQIQFQTGKADIAKRFYPQLDKLVEIMHRSPDLALQITGHSDSRGDEAYNLALSQQRAENIRQYIEKSGISASRLNLFAMGESESIGQNREEYFFDRRVMLRLTEASHDMTVRR